MISIVQYDMSIPLLTKYGLIRIDDSLEIVLPKNDCIEILKDKNLELFSVTYSLSRKVTQHTYLFANDAHKAKFLLRWA